MAVFTGLTHGTDQTPEMTNEWTMSGSDMSLTKYAFSQNTIRGYAVAGSAAVQGLLDKLPTLHIEEWRKARGNVKDFGGSTLAYDISPVGNVDLNGRPDTVVSLEPHGASTRGYWSGVSYDLMTLRGFASPSLHYSESKGRRSPNSISALKGHPDWGVVAMQGADTLAGLGDKPYIEASIDLRSSGTDAKLRLPVKAGTTIAAAWVEDGSTARPVELLQSKDNLWIFIQNDEGGRSDT